MVVCKACGLYLIQRCYSRHWWFRLIREPLVACMRSLAWWNGLTAWKQASHRRECQGCVRYLKEDLQASSPTFRFFNRLIGSRFRTMRDSMLSSEDMKKALGIAAEAMKVDGAGL